MKTARLRQQASWAVSTQTMSISPTTTTRGTAEKRTVDIPTPEFEVPGITDLSDLRPGDQIAVEGHTQPLTVEFVGMREVETIEGPAQQHAIGAVQDRENARTHEVYEKINLADGSIIELVDERGKPLRVYEVAQ